MGKRGEPTNEGTTPQEQIRGITPQPGEGVKGSVPQTGTPERGTSEKPPADD